MISKLAWLLLQFILIEILIHQIVTINADSSCGSAFRGKCSCGITTYDFRSQYVVNCTNEGFSNTSVLEHMPSEVEVVIFTGNVLANLPWNIFGKINEYPKLRVIDMSNNHIRDIRGKTYHHVQLVERLILNHNNLSISPNDDEANHLHPRIFSNFINLRALHLTNAFQDYSSPELSQDLHAIFTNSNLTHLNKLHLEQNEISRFKDKNVFCELPQLQDLHMGDNNLKELNFNVMCLHHLRFLDLERNRFEALKARDMEALEMLENAAGRTETLIVDFGLNPFACDCTVLPFVKWLQSTNVTVRRKEQLMCYRNDEYHEPIMSYKFQKCSVKSQHHNTTTGHQIFLIFFLAVMIFMLVGLIGALLYVSKDRIKYFVSPVVSSRKVHYTTIRDDEIAQEVHV